MAELIQFHVIKDNRGSLISLESGKNIPFEIKRVYYIYGTKDGSPRGFHAHKNLKQVAFCVSGSCEILLDNGFDKKRVLLNSPDRGVLIDSLIWREMYNFSKDCVLIVLADQPYDESDYIRNYDEFKERIKNV